MLFDMLNDTDGRWRIVWTEDHDAPSEVWPYLRSVGTLKLGTPLFQATAAAVRAAEPKRDDKGDLYWTSKAACARAIRAARGVRRAL